MRCRREMDYPRLKMTVQKGKRMKIREVNQVSLDEIAGYMNDEIREQVHAELAPCTPEEFLTRYLQLDCEFIKLLLSEFNIEID